MKRFVERAIYCALYSIMWGSLLNIRVNEMEHVKGVVDEMKGRKNAGTLRAAA